MRYWKRIVSLTLACVMLTSFCLAATSCKKKSSSVKKVSAEDPWYSSKRVELDPKITIPEDGQMAGTGPYLIRDKYLMLYYIMTDRMDTQLGVFDLDGNLLRTIDLDDIMNHKDNFYGYQCMGFSEGEKGARLYYTASMSRDLFYREIDLDTGLPIGSYAQVDLSSIKECSSYILTCVRPIEGYEVIEFREMFKGDDRLIVAKDGKALYEVNLRKAFGVNDLKVIWDIYGAGNGTVMFRGFGQKQVFGVFDLASGQVKKLDDVKPVSDYQNISTTMDGRGCLTKATGIYDYSSQDGKEVCKLNFDSCDINRSDCQMASVLYLDDNKAVLGTIMPPATSQMLSSIAIVYTLEKTEKNPNEGRKVITVASLSDSLTYAEGEALRKFNESNPDYYAKLVLYEQNEYLSSGDSTEAIDETDRQMYNAMSMVSGSLASDIRSGTGPDVVLGASQSIDLLSSKYLMDLTPYLEGSTYNASSYYSNLIDAAKMDGKTYFIPTSFTYAGILTDGSKIDAGKTGFTYGEYASFINGPMNAIEPVTRSVSRMHFLNMCIQRNYAKWISNGRVDFNLQEFRDLAGFFKDTIPEGVSVLPPDREDVWSEAYGAPPAETAATYIENIDSLGDVAYFNFYGDNARIVGIPSSNGEGLTASVVSSFSVTEGTKVRDGAFALLDIMLSAEVQKETRNAIAVNREAVKYKVDLEKEESRKTYAYYTSVESEALLFPLADLMCMGGAVEPGSKLPDVFLQSLEELDSIFLPDNSVLMIISEEIPAYLLGQKDIDTVIATINNRSKTVYDER